MSVETGELVDLSDLDLLDDEQKHARCTWCFPVGSVRFVALCGTPAITFSDGPHDAIPVNACGECVALWSRPCVRCGRR